MVDAGKTSNLSRSKRNQTSCKASPGDEIVNIFPQLNAPSFPLILATVAPRHRLGKGRSVKFNLKLKQITNFHRRGRPPLKRLIDLIICGQAPPPSKRTKTQSPRLLISPTVGGNCFCPPLCIGTIRSPAEADTPIKAGRSCRQLRDSSKCA